MIRHDASSRPGSGTSTRARPGGCREALSARAGAAQRQLPARADGHPLPCRARAVRVTILGVVLVVLGIALAVEIARGSTFQPSECEDRRGANGPMKIEPFLTAVAATAAPLVLMRFLGLSVTAAVVFAGVARAFGSMHPVLDLGQVPCSARLPGCSSPGSASISAPSSPRSRGFWSHVDLRASGARIQRRPATDQPAHGLPVGSLLGTAIGVLPGIGPALTIALLMPVTTQLEPASAFIMFAGILYGAMYGGSTTSILLNTPSARAAR